MKSKYYQPHNLNEIIIGGSGAGKSFRKIKPDIMQMFGSYVVTDPSGEIYRDTANFLREHHYNIKVLNLIDIEKGNTYNPFRYINDEQDVLNIADLFIKNTAGKDEKEDMWSSSAKNLLVTCMMYLFKSENEQKSFGKVMRMISTIRFDSNGRVDPLCEFAQKMNYHKIEHPGDAVSIYWDSLQSSPPETFGSVVATLSTRLSLWAVSAVDILTDEDEMDLETIGEEKTIVYVIIPPARQTYKAVANIFFTQLFEVLTNTANFKYKGKLPLLVSCEIDEFANIGEIPNFQETLAVVRKNNIRICIALQGLSQLKALYKNSWESIIGNCSIFTYLGTNDLDTKEYIVRRLGKITVRVDTKSSNTTGGGTDSENFTSRDLLMSNELAKAMKLTEKSGGNCIVFVDEFDPFFLKKFDTLHHKYYRQLKRASLDEDYGNINALKMSAYSKKREKDKEAYIELSKRLKKKQEEQQEEEYYKSLNLSDDIEEPPIADFEEENY